MKSTPAAARLAEAATALTAAVSTLLETDATATAVAERPTVPAEPRERDYALAPEGQDEDLHPARENAPIFRSIVSAPARVRTLDLMASPSGDDAPPVTPTRPRACRIVVEPGQYRIVDTGEVVTTEPNGATLKNPLASAIREFGKRYPQGGAIGIRGVVPGINLGGPYGAQAKSPTAFWPNGAPIKNLTLLGLQDNRQAGIQGLTVFDGLGGVDQVRLENLTMWNGPNSATALLTCMNQVHGLIQGYGLNFKAVDKSGYGGRGQKWGVRGHGPAQWDLRDLDVDPCLEHTVYWDNAQGTSYFVRIKGSGNGRTLLQGTNRVQSGPSQFGDTFVLDCEARDINADAGGGSDFTFVGCLGLLLVKGCRSYGNAAGSNGALVCWSDVGHGLYKNANGYTFDRVQIVDFVADHPNANRSHVMLSGIEDAEVYDFTVKGNKRAFDLDPQYGGPVKNGSVRFLVPSPVSKYAGFKAWKKVAKNGLDLSDAQIDAMWEAVQNAA